MRNSRRAAHDEVAVALRTVRQLVLEELGGVEPTLIGIGAGTEVDGHHGGLMFRGHRPGHGERVADPQHRTMGLMANALLEKTIDREAEQRPGRAAPTVPAPASAGAPPGREVGVQSMTVGGVASATTVLFIILLATGTYGWTLVDPRAAGRGAPAGLVLRRGAGRDRDRTRSSSRSWLGFFAPAYAVIEGLLLGAISHVYENQWDGIVVQAVLLTTVVFGVMLFLYATRHHQGDGSRAPCDHRGDDSSMFFYLVSFSCRLLGPRCR